MSLHGQGVSAFEPGIDMHGMECCIESSAQICRALQELSR